LSAHPIYYIYYCGGVLRLKVFCLGLLSGVGCARTEARCVVYAPRFALCNFADYEIIIIVIITKKRNSSFKLYTAIVIQIRYDYIFYSYRNVFHHPFHRNRLRTKKLFRPAPISFKLFPHPFPKMHPGDFSLFYLFIFFA
jgi:hypothetical protein